MNEPKRRGRPPKNREELRAEVTTFAEGNQKAAAMVVSAEAQIYAMRVWEGQSPDLPHAERLDRVRQALEAQGLSMEGVDL